MTAHDDAMPEDISDAEAFPWDDCIEDEDDWLGPVPVDLWE